MKGHDGVGGPSERLRQGNAPMYNWVQENVQKDKN